MMKHLSITALAASLVVAAFMFNQPVTGGMVAQPQPLPEFSQAEADWINSKPLSVNDLQGKVVLLDVWTFDCWNCYRSFPWLTDLEARLQPKGLKVIGIHTPEFDHEKKRDNVIAKVKKFGLHHPVMMDNNFRYWNALNNHYWPAYYLVDKQGNIRASFVGETHKGDANAERIEQTITELLAE